MARPGPALDAPGAIGFAPVKSIVEDAFARGIRRPMQLYWGAREARDLYALELTERCQREQPNFSVVPVLSNAAPEDSWSGRRGFVHAAMLADHPDLTGYEVYACDSLQMVEAAVPTFIAHGLEQQYCYSDAFVPSKPAPASTTTV